MNASSAERWSAAAASWAATWGARTESARTALTSAVSLSQGEHVLDVGCGSGEFLRMLGDAGAIVAGADPAAGMLEIARYANPHADIRQGSFERLPWPAATFDVVVAVNALQFAEDMVAGLRESARVLRPGGRICIANWAESRHNDIETVESALNGEDATVDEDYRCEGGLERLLNSAGFTVIDSGFLPVNWRVPDDESLIRGVLLGESTSRSTSQETAIVSAARPFGDAGGYYLRNAFRFAVGTPA